MHACLKVLPDLQGAPIEHCSSDIMTIAATNMACERSDLNLQNESGLKDHSMYYPYVSY